MMVMMMLAVMMLMMIIGTAMNLYVLQGNCVGSGFVHVIEITAVHRNVGAAEAIIRVGRIICN